jgi:hypothetical protein
MALKIVAVVGTSRTSGSISSMCRRVLEGAADRGAEAELLNLYDYKIEYCLGCWQCHELGRCVIDDDFQALFEQVWSADVIVLGSPVYIGTMPGVMKSFFDRHNGLAVFNPDDALGLYRLPWFAKARRLRAEVKRFGARDPRLRGRGFVLVTASTLPFPYSMLTGQTRLALSSLAALPVRMNGHVLARLVYTDTLFRFRAGKRNQKLGKAYRIGQRVAGWAGARLSR